MYEIPREELLALPHIFESPHQTENPWKLDEITHLAAYLAYWLCTFAMPLGDERGQTAILEPYYPHRFARNFGYDQRIPSGFEFLGLTRALRQRTVSLANPHVVEFISARASHCREAGHVDASPIRKKSASKKKASVAAPNPASSYEWWSDFVHACGLPPDAPADSLLPPDTFSDDLAKEWIVYLSSVLTSLGPHRKAFLVQRARSLDDVWSAVSSGARELGLFPQTVIPRPLESVLPSNTVSPSRHLAQPETRVRPDISLPALFPEATDSPHDDAGFMLTMFTA
ncbi:hypothetical protein Taro_037552 [Colocasia esculenta]|uniref:Aminotransferase-like plant mobile domain-containing protein n=1 Tax=Colocasia esculenta TaxID=4460 RepID=A0A843WD59_COLES|nr:hypothetical protein [Colocasia esculenta]